MECTKQARGCHRERLVLSKRMARLRVTNGDSFVRSQIYYFNNRFFRVTEIKHLSIKYKILYSVKSHLKKV